MSNTRQKIVGFLGHGHIYQEARQCVAQSVLPLKLLDLNVDEVSTAGQTCSLLVSIDDTWLPDVHATLNRFSLQQRIPWLPAYVRFGKGIIGPCIFPWESGCLTCAETRQLTAMEHAEAFAKLRQRFCERILQPSSLASWLTTFSQEILALLLVEEMTTFCAHPEAVSTRNGCLMLDLETLQIHRHRFLPDPRCPDCQQLPEDSASAAVLSLQSQHKLAPASYRVRALVPELEQLQQLYTDKQLGIIHTVTKDNDSPNASVLVTMGVNRGRSTEIGLGRTMSYETSQCAAIAEALERYGGLFPGGKRTAVRASYRELGEQALDPTCLGLPSPTQYALPAYAYQPYHPDLVCNWVWGYSFQRQRPILLPECYTYYGLSGKETFNPRFVYEISNGCALGSSLEEAILYGIQEVAERDAFLMTWYARMSVPRIDVFTTRDPLIALLVERIEAMTGCTIHAFNTTLEQGIPSFWVMGVNERGLPDTPQVVCTAGAHLHPEKALASALQELGTMLVVMKQRYQEQKELLATLLADPYAVVEMDDHPLLYCSPATFERLGFLSHSPQQQTFASTFADFYDQEPGWDLLDDLLELLTRYFASGLDVIVVDQTTPEHRLGQFRCVKVIIPGTLPMTFGHANRRINGLPRLFSVPYRLGYAAQPLTEARVNPYPHPFP